MKSITKAGMMTGLLLTVLLSAASCDTIPITTYERVEQLRADLEAAEIELQYEQMSDTERMRGVVYEDE